MENRYCFHARYLDDTRFTYSADTIDACVTALAVYSADPECIFFEAYDLMDEDPAPFLSYVRPRK